MHSQRSPLENIGDFFRQPRVLPRLMLINIALWLLISVVRVVAFLFRLPEESSIGFIIDYLAVPAYLETLSSRPWTLFTYMFLHVDFFHILFNMLWLFWFGKIFLEFLNQRKLLVVYLLGGLAGGLLYILFYNVFPVFEKSLEQSIALGASASVMAVVTAISFYAPGYSVHLLFLGRVRIIYIAIVLFVLDFFMIRSGNAGGHIAHIGGAIFGFFYVLVMRKGMNFSWMWPEIKSTRFFRIFRRKGMRKVYSSGNREYGRPVTDEEYNRQRAERQKRIDDILDKIAKSGYESLSNEEKELLFKAGGNGN